MIHDTKLSPRPLSKKHEKTVKILTLTFDLHYYMIFQALVYIII